MLSELSSMLCDLARLRLGAARLEAVAEEAERVLRALGPAEFRAAAGPRRLVRLAFTPICQVGRWPTMASFWNAWMAASFMPEK